MAEFLLGLVLGAAAGAGVVLLAFATGVTEGRRR